jgi:3-phosphoshikimate 1-carboxyvinyltransferase
LPAEPLTLRVAGSKYFTLRYLLVALLAEGESIVRGPAISDDTAVLVRALRALGAEVSWDHDGDLWALRVRGTGGRLRVPPGGNLQVGNAGAVLRLLLGLGALLPEIRFETDHPTSLGQRPNRDLLNSLATLGIQVTANGPNGLLPITLRGGPPSGGAVAVSGARSSQFLSALLYLAPLLRDGLTITVVEGLHSAPLARATLHALQTAGISFTAQPDLSMIVVPGRQVYRAGTYDVPGDAPSAAALLAAALARGRPLWLSGLDPAQEDIAAVVEALQAFGATLTWQIDEPGVPVGMAPIRDVARRDEPITETVLHGLPLLALAGDAEMHGTVLDGDAIIDSVPVLAAAACFAAGETRFEHVETLRLKESDRIGDLCAELARAGASTSPEPDAIVVNGQPTGIIGGAEVAGHDDHRLVQALAIAAMRAHAALVIAGAEAVAKSYPAFFDDLARLGAHVVAES